MASRLLNVLSDIENDRQHLIMSGKRKGLPLGRNSSFGDIAESIDLLLPNSNTDYLKYHMPDDYGSPENDPELWKIPEYWPDIKDIFLNIETITIPNTDMTAYPIALLLIPDTQNTNLLSVKAYAHDGNTPGLVCFETSTSSAFISNNIHIIYKTSDGSQYIMNPDNYEDITHTWDASKDIVIDGHHFRTICVYYTRNNNWSSYGLYSDIISSGAIGLVYSCIISTSNTFISTDAEALFVCCRDNKGIGNSVLFGCPSNFKYKNKLKYCEISQNALLGSMNTRTLVGPNSSLIIYSDQPVNLYSSLCAFKYIWLNNLRTMNIYYGNTGEAGYMNNIRLRYLHVEKENIPRDNTTGSEIGLLVPTNTNVFGLFKEIRKLSNLRDFRILSFDNLETLKEAFNGVGCTVFYAPKLTTFGGCSSYQDANPEYLIIPNVTSCGGNLNGWGVRYVDARSLKTVRLNTQYNSLIYLNISSAEEVYGGTLTVSSTMQTLILKDGFKFNVSASNCNWLSYESLLDIINKCAQLEEEESYTITLGNNKSKLTDEEIAIATNKGWTIA